MTSLSRAAQSVLLRLSCRTPADLSRLTKQQVAAAWRCGDKTLAELQAWLDAAGLGFADQDERKQEGLTFREFVMGGCGLKEELLAVDRPGVLKGNKILCPCGNTHPGDKRTIRYYCRHTQTWRDVVHE